MKTSPRYNRVKAVPKEFRVYGPPGCGKTTDLLTRATKALDIYGAGEVSICSLTKAAAAEVSSRGVNLPKDSVSTLHARCKRELGAGAPAETLARDFARVHPQWAGAAFIPERYTRGVKSDGDTETLAEALVAGNGVTALERVNIHRQRMTPMKLWSRDDVAFFSKWNSWMKSEGLLDYTGYLEEALRRDALPFQQVVFVDEAQDHTPLQLAVLRSWSASFLILTGDDDQNLYEWSGADPQAFFGLPLPEGRETVLSQSYRVPRAVHRVALEFIERAHHRVPKVYLPRDAEGKVTRSRLSLADIKVSGRLPDRLDESLAEGRSSMLLTACRYMTDPLVETLVENRIPFHNPYRPDDKKWNPLREWSRKIDALLIPSRGGMWTGKDIQEFLPLLVSEGVFIRNGRVTMEAIGHRSRDTKMPVAAVEDLLEPHALKAIMEGDLNFVLHHCPKKTETNWRFQWAMDRALNGEGDPQVIVGTVHSVKGGEADDVFLFPDRSAAGYSQGQSPEGYDAALRLLYTGMTRARDTLTLMNGSDTKAMW